MKELQPTPTGDNGSATPAKQASPAGNGGIVPPQEHRWKAGQSGNPAGRRRCGAVVRDWLNILASQECTAADLDSIVSDPDAPATKVIAARSMLRATTEKGLPDFVAIVEQTDGKPATPVTGRDGGPLQLEAVRDARPVFDVEKFFAMVQQAASAEQSNVKRLAGEA